MNRSVTQHTSSGNDANVRVSVAIVVAAAITTPVRRSPSPEDRADAS
jgi:hypothetical protein